MNEEWKQRHINKYPKRVFRTDKEWRSAERSIETEGKTTKLLDVTDEMFKAKSMKITEFLISAAELYLFKNKSLIIIIDTKSLKKWLEGYFTAYINHENLNIVYSYTIKQVREKYIHTFKFTEFTKL